MQKILGKKLSGKTKELIKISAKTGFYIVTKDQSNAKNIVYTAKTMGLKIHEPITFYEFMYRQYGRKVDGVLIDNADLLLAFYIADLNVRVHAVTMTWDEIDDKILPTP